MTEIRYEHPLRLPASWLKTHAGQRSFDSQFSRNITVREALDYLEEEIRLLVPHGIVTIFSGYEHLPNDRMRKARTSDCGVSVEIMEGTLKSMFACDKWALLEHNIYALSLALRAIRNLETWGVSTTKHLFQSFSVYHRERRKSHSAMHAQPLDDWMHALGLGPTATIEDANAVYRRRAKEIAHDEHALMELNVAMEAARQALR
ncbi:MAG: hypothetical protein K2Q12_07925 [Rickettsiales bacterium]|nr:hypothetical protein [Rickettsiales bacterium]